MAIENDGTIYIRLPKALKAQITADAMAETAKPMAGAFLLNLYAQYRKTNRPAEEAKKDAE